MNFVRALQANNYLGWLFYALHSIDQILFQLSIAQILLRMLSLGGHEGSDYTYLFLGRGLGLLASYRLRLVPLWIRTVGRGFDQAQAADSTDWFRFNVRFGLRLLLNILVLPIVLVVQLQSLLQPGHCLLIRYNVRGTSGQKRLAPGF